MVTTQDYYSQAKTDSLMYEIKTEDVYEDFSCNKEIYSTKSNYYDNSNK